MNGIFGMGIPTGGIRLRHVHTVRSLRSANKWVKHYHSKGLYAKYEKASRGMYKVLVGKSNVWH